MTRRFAVVGSCASGCYAVEALLRRDPLARVDVIERLPTPFGLIRYGVAPDHQGTKAVLNALGRFLANERVRYFGNITIGRDISLDALQAAYDGVILATGINRDRKLGIPGEDLDGVLGSGVLAGWYNDHPEALDAGALLERTRRVVVVGSGNVALDVVRMLAKGPAAFAGSDLSSGTSRALARAPIRTIALTGRRGPAHNKFSLHEFHEVAGLDSVRLALDPSARALWSGASGTAAVLREMLALPDTDAAPIPTGTYRADRALNLYFGLEPVAFLPCPETPGRVGSIQFEAMTLHGDSYERTGRQVTLPADMVVTCIGYEFHDRFGLGSCNGMLEHQDGRIRDRLYVVGWAKRGASGTIGTNRVDSHTVAAKVCTEVPIPPEGSAARCGLEPLVRARDLPWVDFAGWKRIDQAEVDAAGAGRVRRKLASRAGLLAAAAVTP